MSGRRRAYVLVVDDEPTIGEVVACRLRSKIEADPARPRHVETVRGIGYRFAA
jgi:DNA-binding response OmpR family regulator